MTRVLSTLLGAIEPGFTQSLRMFERAAGNPSNDVRLTVEVIQRAKTKLADLGLDPQDTTARELYRALDDRIGKDDVLVRKALQIPDDATMTEVSRIVVQYIQQRSPDAYSGFALKLSVARRLLKKCPPKRAMKQLNYRSIDSMLKHELPQHVYIAAFLCESMAWRNKLLDQYSKLRPSDFEARPIDVSTPLTERWIALADRATEAQRHTIFVAKELGSVVVLPLGHLAPGLAITTLVLVLNAVNDVMSTGSFLKLQQVKSDFGSVVRDVANGEPITTARLEKQPVPWRVVHQFYARHTKTCTPALFEPHITAADLQWHHPESVLASLHPDLSFWHDTRYTGFLHDASSVSMNVVDAAVNYCNSLAFNDRVTQFLKQQLWQECMLRYLSHENIERAIASELAPQLAYAPAPDPDEFDGV
jgi:hypothetical protein